VSQFIAGQIAASVFRDVVASGVSLRSLADALAGRQPLGAAEVATLYRAGLVDVDALPQPTDVLTGQ
jgi:hypothetical protein